MRVNPTELCRRPLTLARCAGACRWAECSDHDRRLLIQDDTGQLEDLQGDLINYREHDQQGLVEVFDIGKFVRGHNWPRPKAARRLADNLEATFRAVNPREGA